MLMQISTQNKILSINRKPAHSQVGRFCFGFYPVKFMLVSAVGLFTVCKPELHIGDRFPFG